MRWVMRKKKKCLIILFDEWPRLKMNLGWLTIDLLFYEKPILLFKQQKLQTNYIQRLIIASSSFFTTMKLNHMKVKFSSECSYFIIRFWFQTWNMSKTQKVSGAGSSKLFWWFQRAVANSNNCEMDYIFRLEKMRHFRSIFKHCE